MQFLLCIINVYSLSTCLDRNSYPPQYPTRIILVSLTEGSFIPDTGVLRVAILSNICFNNVWLLSPGKVRKFPLLIYFRNFIGVGLKQHPCRYWMSSVFVFSLVIITRDLCLNVLEMDMFYKPSDFFQRPFNISLSYLRILISFLEKMAMQSLSHNWPKKIIEAL